MPFDMTDLSKVLIVIWGSRFGQASLMSKIHSPYVVQYVESGKSQAGNVYWIVMELLHGEDVSNILERDGPFAEGEVIKVRFLQHQAFLWHDAPNLASPFHVNN